MKLCIIGSGYVGLVSGTCFAEMGHEVICMDMNEAKIKNLQQGIIPIFEPGLEELVKKNILEKRLSFTTDLATAIKDSLFIFIAVGTPADEDGSADLTHVLNVAKELGRLIQSYKIIVNKSTIPIGTTSIVKEVIKTELTNRNLANVEFDVASNPEFLKEGEAIMDFLKPDRIIIGADNPRVAELMKELYSSFLRNGHPVYIMDIKSAELTKYAANAMLATRISFMNEIAGLCEKTGADIEEVRRGIGSDSRIGMPFLYAGLGYGGSCFPKDVQALQGMMQKYELEGKILQAVEYVNKKQRENFVKRILTKYAYKLHNKKIAIWGLSFKPKTDDMRSAPSIDIINNLTKSGALCSCYCPQGIANAKLIIQNKQVSFANDMYEACINADMLLLLTEWSKFRNPDWQKLKSLMQHRELWDGRNQFDPLKVKQAGFTYYCIGR